MASMKDSLPYSAYDEAQRRIEKTLGKPDIIGSYDSADAATQMKMIGEAVKYYLALAKKDESTRC